MKPAGLEIMNPDSTDPSKIYRNSDGVIFRPSSAFLKRIVNHAKQFFLFDRVDEEAIFLKRAPFHTNVSCWCSAQLSDYLRMSESLQNILKDANAYLTDGHPWNFIFEHSTIKFIDFGSLKEGPDPHGYFWPERAEFAPLELFFYVSYCGRLRRRLAENLHEPAPIPTDELLGLGLEGMSALDCHTSFAERYQRLAGGPKGDRFGKWIGYREDKRDYETLLREDPRCPTLRQILADHPAITTVIDIGANDGLHSKLCADAHKQVLALEIEDASASRLFAESKSRSDEITVACTTLQDYIYHLSFIHPEFRPKIDLALLFAIYHHMVHDFGSTFQSLFEDMERLEVKFILLEFIDYNDVHLAKVTNKPKWYSLENFIAFSELRGYAVTRYPPHELGRQLVLLENLRGKRRATFDRSVLNASISRGKLSAAGSAAGSTQDALVTHEDLIAQRDSARRESAETRRKLDLIKRFSPWRLVPAGVKRAFGRWTGV